MCKKLEEDELASEIAELLNAKSSEPTRRQRIKWERDLGRPTEKEPWVEINSENNVPEAFFDKPLNKKSEIHL